MYVPRVDVKSVGVQVSGVEELEAVGLKIFLIEVVDVGREIVVHLEAELAAGADPRSTE